MHLGAIDPGLFGAACIVERINGGITPIAVIDLPVVGEKSKRRLDAPSFAKWLADYAPMHAVIENGRPMPHQGVSSMFRYGRVCGVVEGVIAARCVPITLVEANSWKRAMNLDGSKEEDARARAILLLPTIANELQHRKDHNRAECLLLGVYALEKVFIA
jgi:crossover junction endodeoxyribonuclease RuvC